MTPPTTGLPPAAPDTVAAAVEALTSRLRKKLDAAVELYAALPVTTAGGGAVTVTCGEDALVTLIPGPSGAVTDHDQVHCSCLLAPRCLHRAAVLSACPVADPETAPAPADTDSGAAAAPAAPEPDAEAPAEAARPLTAAQVRAAAGLWSATAAVLAAGVPAAGAVPQAELLRAAHTARLADLHRAEAAALRVVRGLRGARARHDSHRSADLVAALRELLLTTGLLTATEPGSAPPDPGLLGTARRAYRPGGALRVHGVCREPVISATGYGGVVTHLITDEGRWYSVADVKPGGPARARGAGTATVTVGAAVLNHAELSRGGLLIAGATVSEDGRLGSGKGVRASVAKGLDWTSGPLAALFARPLAQAAADRLADGPAADPEQTGRVREPLGCDLVVLGAAADCVIARELDPATSAARGPLIRLAAANSHPDLAHTANLRQLAAHPGVRIRVLARIDPDRAATLRPLAVGPVPGAAATLRLPPQWQGHADLGYDPLQGAHFPPVDACEPAGPPHGTPADPLADSPLWRVRRLVELAVTGGRRAAAEAARSGDPRTDAAALRRTGFHGAAGLATALVGEADRRHRDVFGRLGEPGADRYASAWLAAAVHLTSAERAVVRATWAE
ncbi:hypothetical protein OG871_03725 [Kitasatospora sp. NBC_00374]|uniref:hypothetical protein n=1 Tax=Kitasatospora sp. NBC_00374 TaxID=2975964 RepID=UPI003248D8D0